MPTPLPPANPFLALTKEKHDALLASGMIRRQYFGTGALICDEGSPGDTLYFIESGTVQCYTHDAVGAKTEYRVVGGIEASGFFGEIALLTDGIRSAHCRAVNEVWAWVLHCDHFDEFLNSHPSIAVMMLREMAQRQKTTAQTLRGMIQPGIAAELADDRSDAERQIQRVVRRIGGEWFLILNVLLGFGWIIANRMRANPWDSREFGFLGLFLSFEGLLVTVLVLAKQNRDEKDSDIRTDRILQNTAQTEQEIRHLHEKLNAMATRGTKSAPLAIVPPAPPPPP